MERGVELPPSSLVPDLLAELLSQLGYAVLPSRQPAVVRAVLAQAGQRLEGHGLYDAADLEPWQPCLVSLRLSPHKSDAAAHRGKLERDDRAAAQRGS